MIIDSSTFEVSLQDYIFSQTNLFAYEWKFHEILVCIQSKFGFEVFMNKMLVNILLFECQTAGLVIITFNDVETWLMIELAERDLKRRGQLTPTSNSLF